MAFDLIRHEIGDWREAAMSVLNGRGGHHGADLMIRAHKLLFEPSDGADEAILKSLAGKVNADRFLDCEPEYLLCVNSDWMIDTKFLRPEFFPEDRPEFDPTPNEWAVVFCERAQLSWNQTYEPASKGRLRRTGRENHERADFESILGARQ